MVTAKSSKLELFIKNEGNSPFAIPFLTSLALLALKDGSVKKWYNTVGTLNNAQIWNI